MIKEIPNYEKRYLVSDTGEVFSIVKNNIKKQLKTHIKSGYERVLLTDINGVKKEHGVHRLVALTFIPNLENKPQVNHKDGNKLNNFIDNLEWVTASENIKHSFLVLNRIQHNKGQTGIKNPLSKKVYQYDLNGLFVKEWDCVSDAARFYFCNPAQIINNIANRNITAYGFLWSYEKLDKIDNSKVLNRKTHKTQNNHIIYKK